MTTSLRCLCGHDEAYHAQLDGFERKSDPPCVGQCMVSGCKCRKMTVNWKEAYLELKSRHDRLVARCSMRKLNTVDKSTAARLLEDVTQYGRREV